MKKLAILGASYLQKPLVEKANAMGLETHCFAWDNEEAICKDIAHFFYPVSVLDKELILEKCQEVKIDGITTIATDICIPTVTYVAEKMRLASNSFKSSILSTNKAEMRKAFEANEVLSPKSMRVSSSENITSSLKFPLIVKPTDRSGSRGVNKVATEADLKLAVAAAIQESIEGRAMIEEFIEGVEVSVETISWKGEHHILAITDKVTTEAPYFVELEHHQPSLLPEEIQQKIKAQTVKALNSLEIEFGASHSEFKINSEGQVYAIEVGARMGGDFIGSHLVELSTGYDFLKGVIDVALGEFNSVEFLEKSFSGVYFLCKETEHLQHYFTEDNVFDVDKRILKNKNVTITNSNDRSGYLIYKSQEKINLQ
ncbi:MAG: ATP-grasp domain-containing protein [Flavobacterium sp.]